MAKAELGRIDEETGEIIPVQNKKEPPRAFSAFLAMLEDGLFHAELSDELQELNAAMNNHVINYGAKAKGKIVITINLELIKGVFDIVSKYKITPPETPRGRSIAWSSPDNNFVPHNPKQQDMFKDVNAKTIRTI